MNQRAASAVARLDGRGVSLAALERAGLRVETVAALLFLGPVAGQAGLLEEGPDVLHELHAAVRRGRQIRDTYSGRSRSQTARAKEKKKELK
jgi:hypothetical protein